MNEKACCENCLNANDEEGLTVCDLDDRVTDDDFLCDQWIGFISNCPMGQNLQ